jgi:stalled ribosome rescue protein Dom34
MIIEYFLLTLKNIKMSGKNKKQFGVWMDSQNATIVGREDTDSGDFVILGHEKAEIQGAHSNENAANNAERDTLQKFLKSITAHMQNVDELHLTGTGIVQEQFMKHLAETPQYKNAITKDSTANKMSDESLVEYITEQFS